MSKNMKCWKCQQIIGFENIVAEKMNGLHAVWSIKCTQCQVDTEVHTSKKHVPKNDENSADINARAVLVFAGVLYSGSSCTALNKLLACLNIPTMSDHIFQKYEEEVGSALEEKAKEICKRATEEEREATIERMEQLCREYSN
ncbi:uncharacterized protein [Venturia canescens]|uniref:uncharacterized protein isoform X2 n=1 Tax=Venturia canescens TaxID=32260 RepID=UPI001C9C51F6|nr:uncharacterized protein LOC122415457 isoform X2 [Venturia canescens]